MKVIVLTLIIFGIALSNTDPTNLGPYKEKQFPERLYFDVDVNEPTKNIVISPASITMCMALAYLGAGGKTAEAFHEVLAFNGSTQIEIAKHYGQFLTDVQNKATKNLAFTMANRIYVNQNYELNPTYNTLAMQYLKAEAKKIYFNSNKAAAEEINSWISQATYEKIKNVVKSDDFDDTTAVVLINAVYFKAPWAFQFKESLTHKNDFFLNQNDKLQIDMMKRSGFYEVADLTDIDATAIKIPYDDDGADDFYMLILLPNTINGLADMMKKLKVTGEPQLQTMYKEEYIELLLPKFKFEFEISLVDVLARMGLKSMFTNKANFSKLLNTDLPVEVSNVKHKAFIEFNEKGTEAAAVKFFEFLHGPENWKHHKSRQIAVNHPFAFAIKDERNVYFAGHVVAINPQESIYSKNVNLPITSSKTL